MPEPRGVDRPTLEDMMLPDSLPLGSMLKISVLGNVEGETNVRYRCCSPRSSNFRVGVVPHMRHQSLMCTMEELCLFR